MIPAKVLIVEDERVVALNLQQQLTRLGYHVAAMATAGRQALQQIREVHPDVVLMDINIEGDIHGIETAALIPADNHISVIYLTAYSEEPTLERARATRPYGYLLKPFSERELHAVIQMVMERRRADQAKRESEERLEKLVAERTAELAAANRELQQRTAERLKVEQSLHRAQKMEALGQLMGGIAHDFNNALTVISGNIELVQRSGEVSRPRTQRALAFAQRGADRAATLTSHLLAFARRQPLAPKPINLNGLVTNMCDMLGRSLGESVSIEVILSKELWWASMDESQLENALLNLALNARDAMPDGGKLTIATANAQVDAACAARQDDMAPGQYAMLTVGDTGCGMSQAVRDRAFEPFFTTKEFGKGTGLGLSQVYGFVKQSGGHVQIDSEPGAGTSVRLYLPRIEISAVHAEGMPDRSAIPSGAPHETILVVEDDDDVRAYSANILRDLGYRVLEATDGPAALKQLDEGSHVSLLFTDVGLPGLSGRQLADEVARRRPDLPVLFATGYARDVIVHDGRLSAGAEVLVKPFTCHALGAKVRDVLDRK